MDSQEIMVLIDNPPDFMSWSGEQKVRRYERVMAWHEYINRLHKAGKIPQAWGSHQLLSRNSFVSSLGVLVAVFRVESWREFDDLLVEDPLRDLSRYATVPLVPWINDQSVDFKRFEDKRDRLKSGRSALELGFVAAERALYEQAPDYIGKYELMGPQNPETDFDKVYQPGDPLQVLIMGSNPEELITHWNDSRKLVHYEKVNWLFDYVSMLVMNGKISHAWATLDFCNITEESGNRASSAIIYQVASYNEFDNFYSLDPMREDALHWSILLQPIADQRRIDQERLRKAVEFYGQPKGR